MPANIKWLHDGHVMHITYEGRIQAAEVKQVLAEFIKGCDGSPYLVHTISDTTRMIGLPPNVLGIMQSRPNPLSHPKSGEHVVVINNGLVRSIVQTLSGLVPSARLHYVRTLDEALNIIDRILHDEGITKYRHKGK